MKGAEQVSSSQTVHRGTERKRPKLSASTGHPPAAEPAAHETAASENVPVSARTRSGRYSSTASLEFEGLNESSKAIISKYKEHEHNGCRDMMDGSTEYWDQRYSECLAAGVPPGTFEWFLDDVKPIVKWLRSAVPIRGASPRILEICCGNSALACALGAQGYRVVATDFCASVIDEMSQKPHPKTVEYCQVDARQLPASLVETRFDAVIGKAALDGILSHDVVDVLNQCWHALLPDHSAFFISCFKGKIVDLLETLSEKYPWKHQETKTVRGKGGRSVYFHRFEKTAGFNPWGVAVRRPRRELNESKGVSDLEASGERVDCFIPGLVALASFMLMLLGRTMCRCSPALTWAEKPLIQV
eukprot:gnl/TRDRNA2_/TRDRNA2_192350_c0_seq1.p1 gnl/TRDRNA2_/TRDRNA2_192350_c0~~gnl/TRDRNA2_/TRDRNA2_192350_c0_seq1.p1  ORF type:complete len:359 (+),score=34.97 gnl/TRDRNA2_/TRDRNA2_192350_c0_seq1:119-1195(+)